MKSLVIFVVFLVIFSSVSLAKVVNVPEVSEGSGEEIPLPLVQENIKKYVYSGNNILATVEDNEVEYYHRDRLSSRMVTDSNGGVVGEFLSLPYGQKIIQTGVDYPFTGKEEDESGLHYFGARYYDSDLGKFTSVDPVEGNEPYAYVSNNPMMLVDPTGMAGAPADATAVGMPDYSRENHFPSVRYLWNEAQQFRSDEDQAAHFWMGLPHALLADVIYNLPGSNANRLGSPELARSDAEFTEFTVGAMAMVVGAALAFIPFKTPKYAKHGGNVELSTGASTYSQTQAILQRNADSRALARLGSRRLGTRVTALDNPLVFEVDIQGLKSAGYIVEVNQKGIMVVEGVPGGIPKRYFRQLSQKEWSTVIQKKGTMAPEGKYYHGTDRFFWEN